MQEMLLTAGKQVTTLIHPSAVIGEDVTLGTGTPVSYTHLLSRMPREIK